MNGERRVARDELIILRDVVDHTRPIGVLRYVPERLIASDPNPFPRIRLFSWLSR